MKKAFLIILALSCSLISYYAIGAGAASTAENKIESDNDAEYQRYLKDVTAQRTPFEKKIKEQVNLDIPGLPKAIASYLIYPISYQQWKENNRKLIEAVELHHNDTIRSLLEPNKIVNVNIRNADDETPLMRASLSNNQELVSMLLKHGADINARSNITGDTALHNAAAVGDEETTKILLDHKADIDATNNNGETALAVAELMDHDEVANLLRQYGAE